MLRICPAQALLVRLDGRLGRLFGRRTASSGSRGLCLRFVRGRRLAHDLTILGLRCLRLGLVLRLHEGSR